MMCIRLLLLIGLLISFNAPARADWVIDFIRWSKKSMAESDDEFDREMKKINQEVEEEREARRKRYAEEDQSPTG